MAIWIAATAAVAVGAFVVAPRLGFMLAGGERPTHAIALQWVAAALFVIAWWLPNPDLGGGPIPSRSTLSAVVQRAR